MKLIIAFLLLGFVYTYRDTIMKIIAAILLLLLVLKFGGETMIAIVLTLGAWALGFGFLCLITGGFDRHDEYDDFFQAWEKWNKRKRR